ncbi:bifunctional metallophosphatase/5'-nucleotidase [Thermodesulfobacteriota bacterium]
MNDIHGHYRPFKGGESTSEIGGLTRAASLIPKIIKENEKEGRTTLVLVAGDLLTGTPFSTAFKGKLGVELLNKMGFQAMVVGNHEFDYGMANLLSNVKDPMTFPLLSDNIVAGDGSKPFKAHLEKKVADFPTNIFIFGLTTVSTLHSTFPKNVAGLAFEDSIKTAQGILKNRKADDLIIALTHLGVRKDTELAQACPKIDVVVGGHSHTAIKKPLEVRDSLVVQAGAYAEYLGRLDLDVVNGRVVKHEGRLIPLDKDVPEDPKIKAIIEQYASKLDARLDQVIGSTDVFLNGRLSSVRFGKVTNLAKIILFSMAKCADADVAIVNGGSIRSSIPKGEIRLGDVYTVLPFKNHLVRIKLKGRDLPAILQRNAKLEDGKGGKLLTWGLDVGSIEGELTIQKVGGKEFDPEKTYVVATNEFLLAGGDGYTVFREEGKDIFRNPLAISDLLAGFVREKKTITAETISGL